MIEMAKPWGRSVEGDEKFLATILKEKDWPHWTAEQKQIFELCLKWFYETHELKRD